MGLLHGGKKGEGFPQLFQQGFLDFLAGLVGPYPIEFQFDAALGPADVFQDAAQHIRAIGQDVQPIARHRRKTGLDADGIGKREGAVLCLHVQTQEQHPQDAYGFQYRLTHLQMAAFILTKVRILTFICK